MAETINTPAVGAASDEYNSKRGITFNHKPVRPTTKLENVLEHLATGYTLIRFVSERECHDHILNTTIYQIEKHGIRVSRREVTVPGYQGKPTGCNRYWLEPEERNKAAVIMGWCHGRDPN